MQGLTSNFQLLIFAPYFKNQKMIHLHDKTFEPFISSEEIDFAVKNMAKQMDDDFFDEVPVFVGVLNGAFMVLSDLMKHYRGMCEVSFVKMASYEGTKTTNEVKQLIGLNQDLEGRTVVIVEDIVDTGNTLSQFLPQIYNHQPASLKIAALLHKPEALIHSIKIDYLGFKVPNKFLLGYGLDYDGLGRNLREIYKLVE